jgi:hypothetical protein
MSNALGNAVVILAAMSLEEANVEIARLSKERDDALGQLAQANSKLEASSKQLVMPCNYVGDWDRNEKCERCTVCGDTRYGSMNTRCNSALMHLQKVGVASAAQGSAESAESVRNAALEDAAVICDRNDGPHRMVAGVCADEIRALKSGSNK